MVLADLKTIERLMTPNILFALEYACMHCAGEVDIARFRLQSTMIRYDFSFDICLHFWWLWNCGGCITSKFIFGPNFVEKIAVSKV